MTACPPRMWSAWSRGWWTSRCWWWSRRCSARPATGCWTASAPTLRSVSPRRASPPRSSCGCATTRWRSASTTRRSGWPRSRPAGRRWWPCSAATTWTSATCARSSAAAWPLVTPRPGCVSAPRSGRRGSSGARSPRARAGSPASSVSAARRCPTGCWAPRSSGGPSSPCPMTRQGPRSGPGPGWSCARPRACSSGLPPRRTCWPRTPCRPASWVSRRSGRPRPWPPRERRETPGTRGTRSGRRPLWPRPRASCARPSSWARPHSR